MTLEVTTTQNAEFIVPQACVQQLWPAGHRRHHFRPTAWLRCGWATCCAPRRPDGGPL